MYLCSNNKYFDLFSSYIYLECGDLKGSSLKILQEQILLGRQHPIFYLNCSDQPWTATVAHHRRHPQCESHPCAQLCEHALRPAEKIHLRHVHPQMRCRAVSSQYILINYLWTELHTWRRGSILAKPPEWLLRPPLLAIFCTSSSGRLAKLPGLEFAEVIFAVFSLKKI